MDLILIRHIRGMRSSNESVRWPGQRRHVSDRGCPLATGLDRLMWHVSGTQPWLLRWNDL
jgi:hypothetical protein